MVSHDVCPVCGSKDLSVFLECPDHFLSKEVFEIFRCSKCGFLFTQNHPNESEAVRYYDSEDYISHSDSSKSLTDKAYQLVRTLMLKKKLKLIRNYSGLNTGTILDIGCGTGHFLNAMKLAGWSAKGIEINEKARGYAGSKFGLEVSDPAGIRLFHDGSFDCITLWHVLEHFQNPDGIMKEIFRLLKPNGICVVALPNSNSFDAKHYGKFWAAFDVPRHLWHFNPETFSKFAGKNRFRIEVTKTLPFDVFYISILSEKYSGSTIFSIAGIIWAKIFYFRSILHKHRSSSIIYLLKKAVG